ncbi:hypothetical protein [Streptomyces violascens]|uniref:hypothetical protein n=1 Tax=Streptomyces violascens TaxID=67381 RepID=UPI00367CA6A3
MHRTRNALRLMTAVAALTVCGCVSGCVSVDARTTPTRPPAAPPARPPGGGAPQTQIVQAPAREALNSVMPPDAPSPSPPPPPKAEQPDAPRHHHHPRAEQPEHHPAAPRKRHPRPAPPPASGDICALGEGYGGWRPDSPEARICREAYGN